MKTRMLALVLFLAAAGVADATPISDKYAQLGGAGGLLGSPTIPETTAPDGAGKFRHYQHGSIYWHPECGAREVHGLIRQRWAQLGWEKSYLGYPITDEINLVDGSGRVSRFKGGELIWHSATNQVSEVKSADLVVDLPFPVGEAWVIGQTNAVVPDTGTGVGNYHLHYCVTTTPDRAAFAPFESVPVAFRNYSVSTNNGASWTYVAAGVPHSGQWVRREAAKPGQQAGPHVNAAATTISHGTVKGTISAGDGKPTGAGKLTIVLLSAWGEPLKTQTIAVPLNNLGGPWSFQFNSVPAYNGLKVAAAYKGPWSRAADFVNAEAGAFNLAPNATATAPALALKTTLIK